MRISFSEPPRDLHDPPNSWLNTEPLYRLGHVPGLSPTPMRGQDRKLRERTARKGLAPGSSLLKWVFHQSILVNLDQKIIFTLMRQEHFCLSLWEEKLKAHRLSLGGEAGRQERVLRVSR